MEAIQQFVAGLLKQFVDLIVAQVGAAFNERMAMLEQQVALARNELKTVQEAGSALLALNLDDAGFKEKLEEFIIEVHNELGGEHWTTRELTEAVEDIVDDFLLQDTNNRIKDRIVEILDERLGDDVSPNSEVVTKLRAVLQAGLGAVDSMR